MCFSKAPKIKPIATAPTASPVIVDDEAIKQSDELRRRRRMAYGKQSTIIAGRSASAGAPAAAPVKTAMGV